MIIVYNTAFVSGVVMLIISKVPEVSWIVFCECLGICFCVMMSAILLVLPVTYKIMKVGDVEAADKVMEEVKSKTKASRGGSSANNFQIRYETDLFVFCPNSKRVSIAFTDRVTYVLRYVVFLAFIR